MIFNISMFPLSEMSLLNPFLTQHESQNHNNDNVYNNSPGKVGNVTLWSLSIYRWEQHTVNSLEQPGYKNLIFQHWSSPAMHVWLTEWQKNLVHNLTLTLISHLVSTTLLSTIQDLFPYLFSLGCVFQLLYHSVHGFIYIPCVWFPIYNTKRRAQSVSS